MDHLERLLVLAVLSLSVLTGCADNPAFAMIRQATYPPDFNYVTGQELRDSMNNLGYLMQQLDEILEPAEAGQPVSQQEVITVLGNIERIGTNLRADEAGSNHPFLEDHMSDFVVAVGRARIEAMANPPRYYQGGQGGRRLH